MVTGVWEKPLTLLDVVATVSGLTADEQEAAEVIKHMLRYERIAFANPLPRREFERWLS
jgi:hypothetical protein